MYYSKSYESLTGRDINLRVAAHPRSAIHTIVMLPIIEWVVGQKIQILILCFPMYELAIFREGEWRYHARYTGSCNLKPIKRDFYCADISPATKLRTTKKCISLLPPLHKYNRNIRKNLFLPMHMQKRAICCPQPVGHRAKVRCVNCHRGIAEWSKSVLKVSTE